MKEPERIEYRPGRWNETLPFEERLEAYRFMRELLRGHGVAARIWWSLEEPDLLAALERDEP